MGRSLQSLAINLVIIALLSAGEQDGQMEIWMLIVNGLVLLVTRVTPINAKYS